MYLDLGFVEVELYASPLRGGWNWILSSDGCLEALFHNKQRPQCFSKIPAPPRSSNTFKSLCSRPEIAIGLSVCSENPKREYFLYKLSKRYCCAPLFFSCFTYLGKSESPRKASSELLSRLASNLWMYDRVGTYFSSLLKVSQRTPFAHSK